jgi:pyruvate dehydrogenase E2 component (dihydrolipoamide acetyltransferase)
MAELLRVPEVAAGATEVVLSEWLVKPGESFSNGDPVAVVETEKAVVEIAAPADAFLLRTLADAGTEVSVGSPMALYGSAEEKDGDLDDMLTGLGVSATPVAEAEPRREVPDTEAESPGPTEDPPPQRIEDTVVEEQEATGAEPVPSDGSRLFISPIARKLLRDAGIPAEGISGSGPNGRIVRRDVEALIADSPSASPVLQTPPEQAPAAVQQEARPTPSTAGFTDVPHTRLRRAVATRLTESKQSIPHFYLTGRAAIDDLLALRTQLNEHSPVRISVNDFVLRAVAVAHTEVPDANVIWTDDATRRFDDVDISVAIASDRGLVTPVLRAVQGRSLSSIAAAVKTYVSDANAGRLQQRDLEGGAISVTNLGMYGVPEFSAIINPPQSAILAVGAGQPVTRIVNGEVAIVTEMTLVLSVDHRVIDGALAAQWMQSLVAALEHPLRLVV